MCVCKYIYIYIHIYIYIYIASCLVYLAFCGFQGSTIVLVW